MASQWKRALVKLSGEALMGGLTHGLDQGTLDRINVMSLELVATSCGGEMQ